MPQAHDLLSRRPEWRALAEHQASMQQVHMRDLFHQDPDRFRRFFAEAAGISLDYSKNLVTTDTMARLMALARACQLPDRIEAMFRGEHINASEDRPALHVALRNMGSEPITVAGCPRFAAPWHGWKSLSGGYAALNGAASPTSRSPTWSVLALAALFSARNWCPHRSSRTGTGA